MRKKKKKHSQLYGLRLHILFLSHISEKRISIK